jgi:3'-phosphoadenosine 5'-phosphosulfate sulfotransferase (PAPS reductase)/FAD synthetase
MLDIEAKLHSQTREYKKRLANTQNQILNKLNKHNIVGISYSTGKDSTVLVHLVDSLKSQLKCQIINILFDCNAVWQDSFSQLQEMNKIGIKTEIIKSNVTYQELRLREHSKGEKISDNIANNWSVYENARKAVEKFDLDLQCIAIRSQESKSRQDFFKYKPNYFFVKKVKVQSFYPLEYWTSKDIWAYIVSNNVPHNQLYYKFADTFGNKPYNYRVDEYLERDALNNGSLKILKKYYPEIAIKEIKNLPFLDQYLY